VPFTPPPRGTSFDALSRRAEQDRIINEYLEFMKKKDREAKKERAALEYTTAMGIEFTLNLN
jgi:hypothetical protein